MCCCLCLRERVCDNFNVEKRARNYRKRHLGRGKIIKSTHTHTSEKPSQLRPSQCGKTSVGTENQFQFVFPAASRQSWGKSVAARGKLKISNSERARAQFASDLALGADIFRFSDIFHGSCCYFWCARQQVRRLPENLEQQHQREKKA